MSDFPDKYFSMRFILLIIAFFFSSYLSHVSVAQNKIAFTVDDLPTVAYRQNSPEQQARITAKLVNTFRKYDVPCTGFVNEIKLYNDSTLDADQVGYLRQWLESGLDLGNHTYSHVSYHAVSFSTYTEDLLRGEEITRALCQEYESGFRYFRHPYLRIGTSKAAHDSLNTFLLLHGYTEAPVTIDNEDYLFALAYSKAMGKGDTVGMRNIGTAFILYMEQKLLYYQKQSHTLFGRNINHILLLHASALNADYLKALIEMCKKNGYEFISLKDALDDDAYRSPITRYGDYGISWIDRWALSQGKKGEFFKGDPETPEFILDLTRQE